MKQPPLAQRARNRFAVQIPKREKFVISVIFLSLLLFISEHFLGKGGVYIVLTQAILTGLLLFWALRTDLKDNFSPQVFLLPFFYSLAFGLFFFLVPARFLTRIIITGLYAFGLYSLFLSENIFIVSSIRTIALLASARTVAFALTILSYFFLSTVIFSFHLNWYFLLPLVFLFSFPLVLHSLWTYTLNKNPLHDMSFVAFLTLSLTQMSLFLWFWPSTPTIIALFLTGFFYSIVGAVQMWLERRLFKNVLSEYLIVSIVVFLVLIIFTTWK